MTKIAITIDDPVEILLLPPKPWWQAIITTAYKGFVVTVKGTHMAYSLPDGNSLNVRVDWVDKEGNPTTVDGAVVWDSSSDAIATVTVDANDSSLATIQAIALGTAQINATADADLGEGTRSLVATLDVQVIAGEAVAGTISPVV